MSKPMKVDGKKVLWRNGNGCTHALLDSGKPVQIFGTSACGLRPWYGWDVKGSRTMPKCRTCLKIATRRAK